MRTAVVLSVVVLSFNYQSAIELNVARRRQKLISLPAT
jgi:hypothetical protein